MHGLLPSFSRGLRIDTVIWWCDYRQYAWVVAILFQGYTYWHSHLMMWLQAIYMGCCHLIPGVYILAQSFDDVITDNIHGLLPSYSRGIHIGTVIWWCDNRQYTWVVAILFQGYTYWHSHLMMWLQTIYMGCCHLIPGVYVLAQSFDDVITGNIHGLLPSYSRGIHIGTDIWWCDYRQYT